MAALAAAQAVNKANKALGVLDSPELIGLSWPSERSPPQPEQGGAARRRRLFLDSGGSEWQFAEEGREDSVPARKRNSASHSDADAGQGMFVDTRDFKVVQARLPS